MMPALAALAVMACMVPVALSGLAVSRERVVLQLLEGDIEFAFYPEIAPLTSAHIFHLVQLGLYDTNHFFRIDKGFVAQTGDVMTGRMVPLNEQQLSYARMTVPLEVAGGIIHQLGALSLARYEDTSSGSSSFSIVLGRAPHLDMQYTVFGQVINGWEVLAGLAKHRVKKEAFSIPLERITIHSTYWYILGAPMPSLTLPDNDKDTSVAVQSCSVELELGRQRLIALDQEIRATRGKLLP
mmetsp:Transcript_1283/g.2061  ORF Transcript_1283/g.2061 Transcript_1283/m.2061 type:complete len:240 (-) Transcript_1283:50-769(-)|eukprot:CAMPEP_0119105486 /NCGR_PEP_ID=MMETSP1180-20130426/3429_1 /TAXON_ID=3052 ORGANISM="Chlamydomonas cf sp, Strain CCMP681" /NCGR_SAMPLE_ID=MMETSP1180 /ASSEMBLY_ACC=CAM_ASM_000741 /LENGTH=239 /DNA_ID=CAMNT_0007090537 /DNA_START=139 /DNA_END=858 /DNA_ORIENTATION=-